MDKDLAAQVWSRLVAGGDLAGLPLLRVDGRISLAKLTLPKPGAPLVLRGARLSKLDFSGAQIPGVDWFDATLDDCTFDRAALQSSRLFGCTLTDCRFHGADLRGAVLGGITPSGARNTYRRVDFSKADLRKTVHQSADVVGCTFDGANVAKVDFQGTVFEDCVFAGKLEEPLFYRHGFQGESYPPNEMKNVDFRRATLRLVAFRGLDLDTVKWPEDDEHIVVDDYPDAIRRYLRVVGARMDDHALQLTGLFNDFLRWVGPHQRRGIVNKRDLVRFGGPGAVEEFLRVAVRR